jgi:hypothetical protein
VLQVYRFGPIAGPDLDVGLTDIRFPRTPIGESVDTTLVVSNTGGGALGIEAIDIGPGDFTLDVAPPLHIAPGEDLPITITYTPTSDKGTREELLFHSNDTDEPLFPVELRGNDIDLRVGDPAPDFTLPVWQDGEFTLSEHRGSVVVLSWFASW